MKQCHDNQHYPLITDPTRLHIITGHPVRNSPVVYWMGRDQRIHDNWAAIYAQEQALSLHVPLIAAFCLTPSFPSAARRHYDFLLNGLIETAAACAPLNITFTLLVGDPVEELPRFLNNVDAGLLVVDFDPLRSRRKWIMTVADSIEIPVHEIDAHNIVPCRAASDRREYGARTIRPKITGALERFLTPVPTIREHPHALREPIRSPDWDSARRIVSGAGGPGPADWLKPGISAGMDMLDRFLDTRLPGYAAGSRDPNAGVESDLSPYLHFGQISAQRVALSVLEKPDIPDESRDVFLEQLIVRRELSDNFCMYTPEYDSPESLPGWAVRTLDQHRADPREYHYDCADFENGLTHDPLWNAAQRELTVRGKMHGYLRMYWAKKILEWSATPEEAIATALYLNDRYSLDGRDPNGYTGVLWSIGGLHDRPWNERQVTGTIRSMTYNGCRRKFDVEKYVARMTIPE